MNIQEFAALKVGNKIVNGMTHSSGEITAVEPGGVKIRWGENPPAGAPDFFVSVNSTSWFHWNRADGNRTDVENEK